MVGAKCIFERAQQLGARAGGAAKIAGFGERVDMCTQRPKFGDPVCAEMIVRRRDGLVRTLGANGFGHLLILPGL